MPGLSVVFLLANIPGCSSVKLYLAYNFLIVYNESDIGNPLFWIYFVKFIIGDITNVFIEKEKILVF
jgi:hypothetical protein